MSAYAMAMKNPYQQWLERIQRVMKKQNASGWVTVRCTDELDACSDDEADDDDYRDGDYSPKAYTEEEVDWIRCVLLPPERERAVEEMTRLVLGEQYGRPRATFRPSAFASDVLAAFEVMNAEFKSKRLWSRKLNILFGFTLAIQQFDSWMEHNEGRRMNGMINEIGDMWNRVLKHSSLDLAIDDEFTRPGIECFLLKFQNHVGDIQLIVFRNTQP